MFKRKWLALLLVILLTTATLAGCSTTELNYFNLAKEISNQKVYSDEGIIELSVVQLPASIFNGTDGPSEEAIRKVFDEHRLEYTGQVDIDQDVCQYDFYIVDKTTSAKDPIFTVVYQKDKVYIKVDDFVKYIAQFCDATQKQDLERVFSDIEWVTINNEDLKSMDPSQPINIDNLLQKTSRQQAIIFRLYDGLLNDAYANYSPNLVTQNGNQYVLTLRGSKILDITKSASIYTINNIEKVGAVLKTFIYSLSPIELADLGLNNEMQVKAAENVDLMVADVMFNRQSYLKELENIDEAAQQELLNIINDTEIVSTLEKVDSCTYDISARLHLNINGGSPSDIFNIIITNNYTVNAGSNIKVSVPTEKTITLTELEQRMSE